MPLPCGLEMLAGVMRAGNIRTLQGDDWRRLKAIVDLFETAGLSIGFTTRPHCLDALYDAAAEVYYRGMFDNPKYELKEKYRKWVEGVE